MIHVIVKAHNGVSPVSQRMYTINVTGPVAPVNNINSSNDSSLRPGI